MRLLATLGFVLISFLAVAQSDSLKVVGTTDSSKSELISFGDLDKEPRFYSPDCEKLNEEERKSCSQLEMLRALYAEVRYPDKSREEGEWGKVVVKFIIRKNGMIDELRIARSISPLIDAEALRAVATLDTWLPGEYKGEKVDAYFHVIVKFEIE